MRKDIENKYRTDNFQITDKELSDVTRRAEEKIAKKMQIQGIDDVGNENMGSKMMTYVCLSLAFVTMIAYFICTIIKSGQLVDQLAAIISSSIMVLFTLFFLFTSLFADNKKGRIFVIIASLLLFSYSGFQIMLQTNIISIPTQKYVENFTGKSLTEVVSWAKENKITLNQVYETSDSVEPYNVINQSIIPGTLIKKVKEIQVTISTGPNYEKEVILPNMLGWDVDDVIKYVDDNFLTNVNIDFRKDSQEKDMIIEQSVSGQVKRNAEIRYIASLGMVDPSIIPMENLVGLDIFHSTTWLKRNAIKYELQYEYSDKVEKGIILKQSVEKGKDVDPNSTEPIILTVSKGAKIKVPNLKNMSVEEITQWIIDNSLRIEFKEEYDDTIVLGNVVDSSVHEGDEIEQGTTVTITISKGPLKMESFTNFVQFKEWADKYSVIYKVEYQFDANVKSGNIIKASHQAGDIIKNSDTVTINVSQGSSVQIPNFVGMTRTKAASECSKARLSCSFNYGGFSDSVPKDTATNQSKRSGSTVAEGTSVVITLSSGKANSYSVFIQDTWMSAGDANATVSTLKSKLGSACPGVTFNIVTRSVNTGVGLITQDSPIKAGQNNFVQGRSYTIYVGK